ncbi:MAG TPA: hypothetical protein VII72_03005 [Myxococcota bacterium]|jgi:hypothetical protein
MSPRRRRALSLAIAALALVLPAATSAAAIPSAQRIADAVAIANRAAGRSGPLWIDVSLRIGEGEPLAQGVLTTHPTGLARLELRSTRGFVERHLVQGSEYGASRDGQLIDQPRPFLPPVFVLQAVSGAALQAALGSFGVAADRAELGLGDDHDCYVLGGRAVRGPDGVEPAQPSLWVDMESFEVVRIDRGDGVRFRFGPSEDFGGVRLPRWISIEAPGQTPARLEILKATAANAPAASFSTDWLVTPPGPPPASP